MVREKNHTRRSGGNMCKIEPTQLSDEETAQRRDAIVRVMASTPPQPRVAKRPVKARRKATQTASDREVVSVDATVSS